MKVFTLKLNIKIKFYFDIYCYLKIKVFILMSGSIYGIIQYYDYITYNMPFIKINEGIIY